MIPESVSKAFENPDTKKVISLEGIYWRNQKAYDDDPDKYKDTRLIREGELSPPHRAFPRVEEENDIGDLFLK